MKALFRCFVEGLYSETSTASLHPFLEKRFLFGSITAKQGPGESCHVLRAQFE